MKALFTAIALFAGTCAAWSQEIFTYVEMMPEATFSIPEFIKEHVQYPQDAADKGIQGKVYVKFVVDTAGKILNPSVARSVHPSLDSEALRVVRLMPDWRPGWQNGKAVHVYFTLPINFKMDTPPPPQDTATPLMLSMPQPEFGMKEFFKKHLNYPIGAKDLRVRGTVKAVYTVDSKGKVINLNFPEGGDSYFVSEISRVIRFIPDWKPGTVNGEPVCVSLVQFFRFDIEYIEGRQYGRTTSSSIFSTSFSTPQFVSYEKECVGKK